MSRLLQYLPLLESLSQMIGCMYLSDLHFLTDLQKARLVFAVHCLVSADADIREWNDAASYITGYPAVFKTKEDAAKSIIRYCTVTSHIDKEEMIAKYFGTGRILSCYNLNDLKGLQPLTEKEMP